MHRRFCFAQHRYGPTKPVKESLGRLKNLKIFVADSVGLTHVLGDVKRTVKADMHFDEKRFSVCVDRNLVVPAYRHQLLISNKLASLFGMNAANVLTIAQNSTGALDQMCRADKIPPLDADAFDDFEWREVEELDGASGHFVSDAVHGGEDELDGRRGVCVPK